MKFHFALLVVLCSHAIAREEIPANLQGIRRAARMTTRGSPLPDASAVIAKKTPPSQSTGAEIISKCSSAIIDEINVGVQGIISENGVEYLYLPLTADNQAACFESYDKTALVASNLVSCCDAAAKEGYNSFRFDGGGCTGFKAWLSPIYTQCAGDGLVSPGLFVAKQKLSNFTSKVPTFTASSSIALARIMVNVTSITDACPYSKTLKITTFSKTRTMKLDSLTTSGEFRGNFYLLELCNDSASTDKRTVTISVVDSDGTELVSVKQVPSSGLTGRHLLSNGVCVLYNSSFLRSQIESHRFCKGAKSELAFGSGFLPIDDLLQQLAGLAVGVVDFWVGALPIGEVDWQWNFNSYLINMSNFDVQSLKAFPTGLIIANANDKLLYAVSMKSVHPAVCIDAPYIII